MLRPKVSWWCSYISYRLHTHTRPKVSHPPLTTCRACTTFQNHVRYYILQYLTELKRGWVQEGRTNGGGIHDSMHAFTRLRVNPIRAWYTTTAGYSGTSDSDSSTNQWLVGSASAAVSISRNATVRLVEPQLVCIPMILCSKASAWVHGCRVGGVRLWHTGIHNDSIFSAKIYILPHENASLNISTR